MFSLNEWARTKFVDTVTNRNGTEAAPAPPKKPPRLFVSTNRGMNHTDASSSPQPTVANGTTVDSPLGILNNAAHFASPAEPSTSLSAPVASTSSQSDDVSKRVSGTSDAPSENYPKNSTADERESLDQDIATNRGCVYLFVLILGLLLSSLIISFFTILSLNHRLSYATKQTVALPATMSRVENLEKKFVQRLRLLTPTQLDDALSIGKRALNSTTKTRTPKERTQRMVKSIDVALESDYDYFLVNHTYVYAILHGLWASSSLNSFAWKDRQPNHSPIFLRDFDREQTVPSLTIFWTLDQDSIPTTTEFFAIFVPEAASDLRFVDVSSFLTFHQRVWLMRACVIDALNEWSRALDRTVIFHEIDYTKENRENEHFSRVVVIAFRDADHTDEHKLGPDEGFAKSDIAHAAYNLLHLNRNFNFQLIPRPISTLIPLVMRDRDPRDDKNYALYLTDPNGFLELTLLSYSHVYAEIAREPTMNVNLNLAAVLLHETGHVLGLSHYIGKFVDKLHVETGTPDDATSMMASFYSEKVSTLTPLDKMAINILFHRLKLSVDSVRKHFPYL